MRIKKGNPFPKAHCSKVNWFEYFTRMTEYLAIESDNVIFSTFCKFCELDKSIIAKQCNGVAAGIGTSHALLSFPFWKFEHHCACNFSFLSWGSFGRIWLDLMDVWESIWICCQLWDEITGGYVEDVGA